MDDDWEDCRREFQEDLDEFQEILMQSFSFMDNAPNPVHMPEMVAIFLTMFQLAFNELLQSGINSERHRDSICTYTQPSPGTSDAGPEISHSSDSMGIRLSWEMNPFEREEQRFFFKRLNDPSDPAKIKQLKDIVKSYKEKFMVQYKDMFSDDNADIPFDWPPIDVDRSDVWDRSDVSAEQSDTSKPGCSKWPTSAEQSGASEPGCSKWPTSAEKSDGASKPGCSTRQTSAEREASTSWNFFRQDRLNSAEPSARADDRAESSFRPLSDERLIDSLKHTSRSKPSQKPEARECGREISSERWGGPIQRVESTDTPRSSSLYPDSRPPPKLSLSSNQIIDSNEFVTPEQRAESFEHNVRKRRREPKKFHGIYDEVIAEITGTWEKLQHEKKQDGMLTRQRKKEAERLAASQPGPSGLRRSSRLKMAQKRKTQMPKGLSEGSKPKTCRERDSDTSDSSD